MAEQTIPALSPTLMCMVTKGAMQSEFFKINAKVRKMHENDQNCKTCEKLRKLPRFKKIAKIIAKIAIFLPIVIRDFLLWARSKMLSGNAKKWSGNGKIGHFEPKLKKIGQFHISLGKLYKLLNFATFPTVIGKKV